MRRWSWEHVVLVWLLAAGIAVGATLVRFPPGRPLRPLRPAPSALLRPGGLRWLPRLARRERALMVGWVLAPLGAAALTVAWALGRRRAG